MKKKTDKTKQTYNEKKKHKPNQESAKHPSALPAWIWGFAAGIIFLGIGAAEGQFFVLWRKAVMICMECIGIG